MSLSGLGSTLYADFSESAFVNRAGRAQRLGGVPPLQRRGRVLGNRPSAYALAGLEEVVNLPADSNGHYLLDEEIPFYQMVLHGCLPYAGEPVNYANNTAEAALKLIETGAMPGFEWMYQPNYVLHDVDSTYVARFLQGVAGRGCELVQEGGGRPVRRSPVSGSSPMPRRRGRLPHRLRGRHGHLYQLWQRPDHSGRRDGGRQGLRGGEGGSASMRTKKRLSISGRKALTGWVFSIPFLIGFFLFFLVPVIHSGILSFHTITAGPTMKFVGWQHYYDLFFTNAEYIPKLKESLLNLLIDFPCILLFSFFIATILNQRFHGRTVARAVFFLPVVIYSGVLAMMQSNQIQDVTMSNITAEAAGEGTGILQINQMVAGLLGTLNLSGGLLDFVQTAVDRVQDITMASGVQILIFLAGLQTISPSLYEASTMEGATGWENFWKVTFPMISPIILVNAVYTIIDSMAGLNNPIIDKIYYESVVYGRHGPAAAMSWLYFLIISAVLLVFIAIASRKVYYEDAR